MNKLNRIIGGSAIAITLMAMGATMPAKAMQQTNCANMLRTQVMKIEGMAKAGMPKVMKPMSQKLG